jgi:hypothetical protein
MNTVTISPKRRGVLVCVEKICSKRDGGIRIRVAGVAVHVAVPLLSVPSDHEPQNSKKKAMHRPGIELRLLGCDQGYLGDVRTPGLADGNG